MFDLRQIKRELERIYDVEFIIDKWIDTVENLHYQSGKNDLNIHISHYSTYDSRNGMEFIDAHFWDRKNQRGKSGPNDDMEELIHFLDSIKLPRRTTPKEDYEQISLF